VFRAPRREVTRFNPAALLSATGSSKDTINEPRNLHCFCYSKFWLIPNISRQQSQGPAGKGPTPSGGAQTGPRDRGLQG